MKQLWYRFLGWAFRVQRDVNLRIQLEGSLDGPVDRIVEVHGQIIVFTRYGRAYRIWYDYGYVGMRMKRVL